MTRNQRLAVIASCLVLCSVIGLAIFKHAGHTKPQNNDAVQFANGHAANETKSAPPSAGQITDTVKSETTDPVLQSGDFTVVNSQEPVAGWYVLTVSPAGGVSQNETLILKGTAGDTTIVAGPGTAFSADDLASKNVPQAVLNQVLVYDDGDN